MDIATEVQGLLQELKRFDADPTDPDDSGPYVITDVVMFSEPEDLDELREAFRNLVVGFYSYSCSH